MRKALTATVAALALAGAAVAVGVAPEPGGSRSANADPAAGNQQSAGAESDLPQAGDDRSWVGQPSSELRALEDALASAAGQHEDVFAGVEYARDYSTITVFATDLAAPEVMQLRSAISSRPGADKVLFKQATYSMEDLVAAADAIDLAAIPGASSAGPDVATNSVVVGRDDSKGTGPAVGATLRLSDPRLHASKETRQRSERSRRAHPTLSDVTVRVHRERGKATASEDRYNDIGPYFTMGAAIFQPDGARCSLGVPLKVNGTFMALTAGHCTASSFTNQNGPVGTTYTTAYSANADLYGDWKLIKGQHYNLSVWSGSAHGSSTLPMSGIFWDTRPIGTQMCSSGSTTGQVCRFIVTAVNDKQIVDNVDTRRLTRLVHDSDLNGSGDCSGWAAGDSGGPTYYSNGAGGVIANGIVTAHRQSTCEYWYTQLSGVRAWKSSVVFG